MYCGAVERHRLTWEYFERMTNLFDGERKEVLHIAPEPIFERNLTKRLGSGYLTADLYNPQAMVKMDITNINYPDDNFDVIYCSHVLEHVLDDRKAMQELCRVLRPDGWALLLVPITAEKTYEDERITDPTERLKHFGQEDHVRRYGSDFVDRLTESGFHVKEIGASDFLDDSEVERMGLDCPDKLYLCTISQ
jgi:SAM-dependent methyltransferase